MKLFLSLLLVCAVLGELTPERKENLRKLAHTIKAMKLIVEETKKIQEARKLQSTDTTDGGKNLDEPTRNITEAEADANQNYSQNTTSTNYRIKGFYGFQQEQSASSFSFGMIFSFIQQMIAQLIKMRIILKYKNPTSLRNLQEGMSPQSVKAECKTSSSLAKSTPTDETDIDYTCTAEKVSGFLVETVKLDASYPMELDDKTVEFTDIYLDEDAAEQANNIAKTEGQQLFTVSTFSDTFNIQGTTKPNATFLEQFLNNVINLKITYISGSSRRRLAEEEVPCTVKSSSELQCTGEIPGQITQIEKNEGYNLSFVPSTDSTYPSSAKSESNSAVYRKSSSGLSGGAIAGIVIACVVVLIAAAVAAIMLRKPSPPVDNTTVVDLKQENI